MNSSVWLQPVRVSGRTQVREGWIWRNIPTLFFAVATTILLHTNSSDAQQIQNQTRLSVNSSGVGGNAASGPIATAPNTRFSVFQSSANNLVSGDTNSSSDIFLRDSTSGLLTRLSVGPLGAQADDSSASPTISPISPNGFMTIAYESDATNLVSSSLNLPDSNNSRDVFYVFPSLGVTERVSIGVGKTVANSDSREASVTIQSEPNIGLVAFTSDATNLIGKDSNGKSDIFLASLLPNGSAPATVSIIRVSETGGGAIEANGNSRRAKISGNGAFIVYESEASNLTEAGAGSPATSQIYLYNVGTKVTSLISRSPGGQPGNGASQSPAISFSGNVIVYLTAATNIVADGQVPSGTGLQVMRYNLKTGQTERVNTSSSGVLSNGSDGSLASVALSADGRDVIFSDTGSNLVLGDTNAACDIFIKDTVSSQIVRVSQSFSGGSSDDDSFQAAAGATGYTALTIVGSYASFASNVVQGDTEGRPDVFSSSIVLTPQAFAKGLTLETPPDVVTTSNRGLRVSLLQLQLASTKAATLSLQSPRASSKPKLKLQYSVVLTRTTPNGRLDVRRKTAQRNLVTFRSLPSGTYSVTYRAETTKAGRVTARSSFSAPERVTVG